MLLSAWTEYDGTFIFGRSLLCILWHDAHMAHTFVPTLSRIPPAPANGGEVKWSVDVCHRMRQIHQLAEWNKELLARIVL